MFYCPYYLHYCFGLTFSLFHHDLMSVLAALTVFAKDNKSRHSTFSEDRHFSWASLSSNVTFLFLFGSIQEL